MLTVGKSILVIIRSDIKIFRKIFREKKGGKKMKNSPSPFSHWGKI